MVDSLCGGTYSISPCFKAMSESDEQARNQGRGRRDNDKMRRADESVSLAEWMDGWMGHPSNQRYGMVRLHRTSQPTAVSLTFVYRTEKRGGNQLKSDLVLYVQ